MHCVRRVHYDCLGVVTTVSNPVMYNNIIAESYPTPRGPELIFNIITIHLKCTRENHFFLDELSPPPPLSMSSPTFILWRDFRIPLTFSTIGGSLILLARLFA